MSEWECAFFTHIYIYCLCTDLSVYLFMYMYVCAYNSGTLNPKPQQHLELRYNNPSTF